MPNEQPVEPIEIEEEPEESQEQEILSVIDQLEARHAMINIAEDLEQNVLDTIASKVVDDYNTDKDSRSVWERSNREVLELAKLEIKKTT